MSTDKPTDKKSQENKIDSPAITKPAEPATPAAERDIGETAKPSNDVEALDSFGKPKGPPGWTREAITTQTVKPSYGGPEDEVAKEQAGELKE